MLNVKLSMAGAPANADLSQYVGNDQNIADGCHFSVNSSLEDADIWLVVEGTEPFDRKCRASMVIFLSAEQVWGSGRLTESRRHQRYLACFDRIYTTHALYWPNVSHTYPFLPWMINARHGAPVVVPAARDVNFLRDLEEVPKHGTLSVICSDKTYSAGHRLRLRFVEALAKELGDDLHWFGRGIREAPTKWEAIAPYRFHLVLENQSVYSSFSEKIYDSFLGLSFPIYWGAPNLADYYHPNSFAPLDIHDLKGSLQTIKGLLGAETDRSNSKNILTAKDRTLDEHNVFLRLARIANSLAKQGLPSRRLRQLPKTPIEPSLSRRSLTALGRLLQIEIN